LNAQLTAAEARRAENTPHPEAIDMYFLGRARFNKGQTLKNLTQAHGFFFARALALDPENVEALVGANLLLLAQSAFERAIPDVLGWRMPPASAGPLCSICERPDMVFQLPQVRWDYVSVHHGPPVGPLGASCREIACPAPMAIGRYHAN
jgi:hypothetical protein